MVSMSKLKALVWNSGNFLEVILGMWGRWVDCMLELTVRIRGMLQD